MLSLDKNVELQSFESKTETMTQLRDSNRLLKIQSDDLNCEIKRLESIVCNVRSENACLCKQLETTKHHMSNAVIENNRMANELATITAELHTTKKCLTDSQKESELIRTKLQSYIHEIERIDGLIAIKDNDRKQTELESKDVECDKMKLIEQIHTLNMETSEFKGLASEYQHKITLLTDQLCEKENAIELLEKQVLDLSTEIEMLRNENTKMNIDLEAQINLCEKLDIQKKARS